MLSVVTLLCALAALAFCSRAAGRASLLAALAGFGVVIALGVEALSPLPLTLSVQPPELALLLALASLYVFMRPERNYIAMGLGGMAAGGCAVGLIGQGFHLAPALILPVVASLLSAWFAQKHSGYVDERVRNEAALIIFVFALSQAIVPAVADGWRSAAILHGDMPAHEDFKTAMLSLGIGGLFLISGALYQWWIVKR